MNEPSKYCHLEKIITTDLLRDPTALVVTMYLFSKADEGGTVELTRTQASLDLGMNPNTFHSAYDRVVTKYRVGTSVGTSSDTSKFTTFRLYESPKSGVGEASDTRHVTSGDTSKRKESVPSLALPPITPNSHSTLARKENTPAREGKYSSLQAVTLEDMQQIADDYHIGLGKVQFTYETLKNYCASKGKVYKDYKAALRNFILKDMKSFIEEKGEKRAIDLSNL